MDRRTVLAFILIGLIIFLMPYYMELIGGRRPQPPPDLPEPPAETRGMAPRASPPQERHLARPEPPSAPPEPSFDVPPSQAGDRFDPAQVAVETELYQAVFTTRGGRLISWRLKRFQDPLGDWLELVGPGGSGLGLSVSGESMDALEFLPDRSHLSLFGSEQGELVFRATTGTGTVEKRIRFQGNRYRMDMALSVPERSRGSKVGLRWTGGLADTEGSLGKDQGFYGGVYDLVVTLSGGEVETWDVERINGDERPPSGQVSWVGVRNKYFLAALLPPEGRHELHLQGRAEDSGHLHYGAEIVTEAGPDGLEFGIFVGPISYDILRAQNLDLAGGERELQLDEFMDYGWAFFRPIMKPITILILRAFLSLHTLVPNYGLVIVTFSILVKIVVFPLTHKSLEAAAKMQQLQPQIQAVREKFPDDQQKVNQATMKLYKEQKINPLGGCLPMMLQMPILISLFNVFRASIELRQAGFILWIDDLSQPDRIPLGDFEIHLLPLLMAGSMFVQQKMTMKDPKQAALVYIMPIFMTYIFWSMSSGLVLYWTLFNVLTLLQQQVMEKTKLALGTA